jgi:GNAT superfamily N-acetyltransferase
VDSDDDFILRRTIDVTLRDGGRIRVRPIAADDKELLAAGFRRLSPDSRYRRFFSSSGQLAPQVLAYLTEIDYDRHFAWGARDLDLPGEPGVGVARYVRRRDDPATAEVAVAVVDDHHRRGIGTILLTVLGATAREQGVERLVAPVLSDNAPVQALLHGLGATTRWDPSSGMTLAEVPLPPGAGDADIRDSRLYELLRAAARGAIEVRPTRP